MLLTPHFDVADLQNLLAAFWLENDHSFTLVAPERARTYRWQPEERKVLFSFPSSQIAKHGFNHPKCHPSAAWQPRKDLGGAAPRISGQAVPKRLPQLFLSKPHLADDK
ncbi:hypothetical protein P7K49_024051, partial [Saguinus oedipus]